MGQEQQEKSRYERLFGLYMKEYVNRSVDETQDPLENPSGELTEEQLLRLLLLRQAQDIKAMRAYMKFFVGLSVVGIVFGVFAVLFS